MKKRALSGLLKLDGPLLGNDNKLIHTEFCSGKNKMFVA